MDDAISPLTVRAMRARTRLSPLATMAARAAVGILIALGSAAVAACWGDAPVRWMLPAMRSVLQELMPEFHLTAFDIGMRLGQAQLHAQAFLAQPLQIGRRVVDVPVWTVARLTLGAFWQPVAVAIASAAVLSFGAPRGWPQDTGSVARSPRSVAGAVVFSFICAAFAAAAAGALATTLSVFLAPAMLAGMMIGDIYWHEASDQIVPHIVRLPRFLEEGGWLMTGLLVGVLVGLAACAGSAVVRRLGSAKLERAAP